MFEEIYKKPEYYLMNDFQNVQRNCTVAYDIHIANHTVSFGQEPDAWRLITTMSTPKRKKSSSKFHLTSTKFKGGQFYKFIWRKEFFQIKDGRKPLESARKMASVCTILEKRTIVQVISLHSAGWTTIWRLQTQW